MAWSASFRSFRLLALDLDGLADVYALQQLQRIYIQTLCKTLTGGEILERSVQLGM